MTVRMLKWLKNSSHSDGISHRSAHFTLWWIHISRICVRCLCYEARKYLVRSSWHDIWITYLRDVGIVLKTFVHAHHVHMCPMILVWSPAHGFHLVRCPDECNPRWWHHTRSSARQSYHNVIAKCSSPWIINVRLHIVAHLLVPHTIKCERFT